MNRQEIDEMMRHLPSQQPRDSLRDNLFVGIIITVFFFVTCVLPDVMR